MGARVAEPDPLLSGFYSERDAARLLRMDSARRIHGWLEGWKGTEAGPVIKRDFARTNTVSFLDLMELRFVEHFRGQGVPLQTLRKAAERLRQDWSVQHPFALSQVKYLTDRRTVFGQVAESLDDRVTWDLATNQYEMWATIEALVAKGVEFNPASDLAERWQPLRECPNIIVDPRLAFGQPIVAGRGVPTAALFRQWKAEGSKERVARWFHVTAEDVSQAVDFELTLAA